MSLNHLHGNLSKVINSTLFGACNENMKSSVQIQPVSHFVGVVQHLHEVPLARCPVFGRPVAGPAPEAVPGLVMPLLLLLVKLAVPLIVIYLLMNLKWIIVDICAATSVLCTWELSVSEYLFLSSMGCLVDKMPPLKYRV